MARTVEFNECEIIDKAMNVFWEKGYQATSMQDLVDAMQINRSSIYNTFGDKHQLFMKCISSYFDNAMLEIKEKVAKQSSAKQALINPPLPRESLRVVLQFKILKNTNIV